MLDFSTQAQIDFLTWVDIDKKDIARIIELSKIYSDIPMDLADATLVVAAEKRNIKEIITIDSDYFICRTSNKETIINVFRD